MLKCLVTEKIREEGLQQLRDAGFQVDLVYDKNLVEIKQMVGEYDVLIVRAQTPVDKDMIDAGKNLKIIAMGGIGLNHIDVEYAKSKGIDVYNVPAGSTEAVAELAVGTVLTVLRRIPEANAFVKAGNWDKTKYIGREVKGKTVGILSLGKIGFRVAEVLKALGATEILTYDPYLKQEIADMIGAKIVSLEEVFRRADIISIHTPLTDETYHMVDASKINLMKDGSFLFNFGRGGIVCEDALYDALKSGKLLGAGFDVLEEEPPKPDHKLYTLDNFTITPHIGAGTVEAQIFIAQDLAERIIAKLGGGSCCCSCKK